MKIKTITFVIVVIICSISFQSIAQSGISEERWRNEVFNPYIDLLSRYANSTIHISQDTEAEWAAYYADSIAQSLKKAPFNFKHQLAGTYLMEISSVYGMSYPTAIFGIAMSAASNNEDIASKSNNLLNIISSAEFLYNKIDFNNLSDYSDLYLLNIQIYSGYNDFFAVMNFSNEKEIFDYNSQLELSNDLLYSKLGVTSNLNGEQALRCFTILDQSQHFCTINALNPLIINDFIKNIDQIMMIAEWNDAATRPIINHINNETLTQYYISDEEYFKYMKEAVNKRIEILNIFIDSWTSKNTNK